MYFRMRCIIKDFEFGYEQISVSDPARRIEVVISKRPADGTSPGLEPNQRTVTATCQKEVSQRLYDEALSSRKLSSKKAVVGQVRDELIEFVLHTLRLARWRTDFPKCGPNPIQCFAGFDWSLDGEEWRSFSGGSIIVEFGRVAHWTSEAAEFVRLEVLGQLDEPLGHELLREAVVNRKENLRSSLILAVVAAEVGFKQFASKVFPDTDWILERLPSPPLIMMIETFPWAKIGTRVNGKVPSIPLFIISELKKAVTLRNQIVHAGGVKLELETLDPILQAVHHLLYFLDAFRGQKWALDHVSIIIGHHHAD